MLAKRCFLLAHALLTAHVPAPKKIRPFSTTVKPWSTMTPLEYDNYFSGMPKNSMCGPLTPSQWTLHHSCFFHMPEKFTLGPADPAQVPEKT